MIRRISEGCLDLRNNKWYLSRWSKKNDDFVETDKLLTGLIICEDNEESRINEVDYKHEVKICKDGVIIGDYNIHPYFSKLIDFKSALKISYGMIEVNEEWEPDTYYEKPFTGVVYFEKKDKDGFSYIEQEILYKDGSPSVTLEYFEDGSLKSLNFKYNFKITCSKPNVLSFLSIDKDYFRKYPKLEQTVLEEDIIENASSFRRFKADKRLVFSNDGVNDEVFDAIWSNRGMEDLEQLIIRTSSLTKSSYYKLLNLEKLSDLSIEITIDMMSELADSIKFLAKELKAKEVKVSLKMNKKMIEV